MPQLRISAISYLNTAPLMWDFENGESAQSLKQHFQFSYTIPSYCADALKAGTADIGIIPVAAYTTIPDLVIVSDVAIACKNQVRSILLVSKVPLEKIRSVATDSSSRTTSALEVREELSVATLRIFSRGTLLTRRMERTWFLQAMATSGTMTRSGIVV